MILHSCGTNVNPSTLNSAIYPSHDFNVWSKLNSKYGLKASILTKYQHHKRIEKEIDAGKFVLIRKTWTDNWSLVVGSNSKHFEVYSPEHEIKP